MDEQETAPTDASNARETSSARRAPLGVVTLVVAGVALAGFAAIWSQSIRNFAPAAPLSTASWQVYHDPLGLFVVRLPPGWKASASLGSFSEGGPGGRDSGQNENVTFNNPSLGDASPILYVYAQQSHDATLNCGPRSHETSSFNGYPADTSQPAVLFFESENAHFQLDEVIPGVLAPINPGGPVNPPPTPTPPPAATVTADQSLLASILSSLQPTARPLACG